eukprot:9485479-Pyramimonas_sp.AAC.1
MRQASPRQRASGQARRPRPGASLRQPRRQRQARSVLDSPCFEYSGNLYIRPAITWSPFDESWPLKNGASMCSTRASSTCAGERSGRRGSASQNSKKESSSRPHHLRAGANTDLRSRRIMAARRC